MAHTANDYCLGWEGLTLKIFTYCVAVILSLVTLSTAPAFSAYSFTGPGWLINQKGTFKLSVIAVPSEQSGTRICQPAAISQQSDTSITIPVSIPNIADVLVPGTISGNRLVCHLLDTTRYGPVNVDGTNFYFRNITVHLEGDITELVPGEAGPYGPLVHRVMGDAENSYVQVAVIEVPFLSGYLNVGSGVLEYDSWDLIRETTIAQAKTSQDGQAVSQKLRIVTVSPGAYPDSFYIASDDRAAGIRVMMPGHGKTPGEKLDFTGTVQTSAAGERYILASALDTDDTGTPTPLNMPARSLGGGSFGNPEVGRGQTGLAGMAGLNTIGQFVKITGRVESLDTQTGAFRINDGSSDPVLIQPGFEIEDIQDGDFVSVTGAVSLETVADAAAVVLLPGTASDIVLLHR